MKLRTSLILMLREFEMRSNFSFFMSIFWIILSLIIVYNTKDFTDFLLCMTISTLYNLYSDYKKNWRKVMLTKSQQLSKNRQTKKPNMKNKPKITQHERDYLQWLQTFQCSCFVCGDIRNIQFHHVKYKSTDRKNHKLLIPLCIEHHKGNKLSPHSTPKLWREQISMEKQIDMAEAIYQLFLRSEHETN